ncbi:putative Ran-specific GTPase-activating protein [Podospora australis]|uniref:Ran-specific GTPase-activating protein n=1 Tax=Podospora australis TaxID=1536484 RepID=A0AAN6X0Q1_9PEZI|nr:putative Ran-specific GTPase-activating protein [Podospora australis]
MDALLAVLGHHAVNYAIKSGMALTSQFAVQQCGRLLKTVDDKSVYTELKALQRLLNTKVKIISPALDLIQFKSGRGNSFLDAALPLATALHREIVRLGNRLQNAAAAEEDAYRADRQPRKGMSEAHHAELVLILADIKRLLDRIDRDIPFIQLAISASGETMSAPMNPQECNFSPSRLMQASTLVSFGDLHFSGDGPIQVGPSFTLTLYMLFLGHSRVRQQEDPESKPNGQTQMQQGDSSWALQHVDSPNGPGTSHDNGHSKEVPYGIGEGERKPIWQEVMHKARVRLLRTPVGCVFDPAKGYLPGRPKSQEDNWTSNGYSYHLELVEDLDDGRLHEENGERGSGLSEFGGMRNAGMRESIPVHQFSRIFYTETGVLLNIGDAKDGYNNPVLLLKRDPNAISPLHVQQELVNGQEKLEYGPDDSDSDDQDEIDRQLWEESHRPASCPPKESKQTNLPPHLDPEWLALEVYMEDDFNESDSETEDEEDEDSSNSMDTHNSRRFSVEHPRGTLGNLSSDPNLVQQFRHLSIQSDSTPSSPSHPPSSSTQLERTRQGPQQNTPKSPFDSVTSSLSLLEMLIRLTSLQESQQVSHLAIPDDFTMHFLQNTTTTGMTGNAAKKMKEQAKRHMGFDPYDDSHISGQQRNGSSGKGDNK